LLLVAVRFVAILIVIVATFSKLVV
jgi:hypothetical protein